MKLSLLSMCFALVAVVLVILPSETDALFHRQRQLHTYDAARTDTAFQSVAMGEHPARALPGGIGSFSTARMTQELGKIKIIKDFFDKIATARIAPEVKVKIFKDFFDKVAEKVMEKLKEKAEEERKKPERNDPEEIVGELASSRRENKRDRDPIHRMGPFGREFKIQGTSGREFEGAFREHGKGYEAGRQFSSSGSRSSAGSRGTGSSSRDRDHGSDRRDRRNRGEQRSHRNRGESGRRIEH